MPAFLGVIVGLSMLDNALASHIIDDELVRRVLSGDREADFRLSKYLYNEDFLSRLSSFACGNLARCCAEGSFIALLKGCSVAMLLGLSFKPQILSFNFLLKSS